MGLALNSCMAYGRGYGTDQKTSCPSRQTGFTPTCTNNPWLSSITNHGCSGLADLQVIVQEFCKNLVRASGFLGVS